MSATSACDHVWSGNGYVDPHHARCHTCMRTMVEVEAASGEALRDEIARLRSVIDAAIIDLDAEHRPDWSTEKAKAAGKEPIGCVICYPRDSDWPCISAMVLDDLREAVASGSEATP